MKDQRERRKQKKVRETGAAAAYRPVVERHREPETGPKPVPHRKSRSLWRLLLRLLLVAAILGLLFAGWQYRDRFMPDGFLVWADELFSGGDSGSGFPTAIAGTTAKSMMPVRNTLAYLTDTSLVMLGDNGGQVVNRSHSFANPVLKVAGTYALVAENGGHRIRLEQRSKTVLEHTHTATVLAVGVAENGSFAVTSGASKSYLSQVAVYNAQDENIYNWYSADQIVSDVALSADGRRMAVIGLSTGNGNLCSTLSLFDLNDANAKPITFSDTDIMLCSVQFLKNGQLAAVGDSGLWLVTRDGKTRYTETYGDYELLGCAFASDSAAVALRQYGTTTGGCLLSLGSNGKVAFRTEFAGSYRDMSDNGKDYLLLTNATVFAVAADGKVRQTTVNPDGQLIAAVGGKAYVMGLTEISTVLF